MTHTDDNAREVSKGEIFYYSDINSFKLETSTYFEKLDRFVKRNTIISFDNILYVDEEIKYVEPLDSYSYVVSVKFKTPVNSKSYVSQGEDKNNSLVSIDNVFIKPASMFVLKSDIELLKRTIRLFFNGIKINSKKDI
jgi:hypothetical protein